jgi:hypothetical protein
MPDSDPLGRPVLDSVRQARRDFLATLEPVRPQLYRYARRLAGNVWDAEDLLQETLVRAFARAAVTPGEIAQPLAWLVDTVDGAVARLRWYYFCPETLRECATELGCVARTHGYG